MLHVAFQRYHVEPCFEEEKGELGMDPFEVRTWRSLRRHLLLTAVSHLFLAKVREKWRGEKPGPDGLPPASKRCTPRWPAGTGARWQNSSATRRSDPSNRTRENSGRTLGGFPEQGFEHGKVPNHLWPFY